MECGMRNAELKEKNKDTHLNWEFGIWNAETRDLKTENRGQKTDDPSTPDGYAAASRGQRADDRGFRMGNAELMMGNGECGMRNAELMYSARRELLCRTVDFKISVAAGLKSLPARQRRINLRRAASLIEKKT